MTGGVGNVIEAIEGGTEHESGSLKILEGGSRGVFLAKTQQNVNILMYPVHLFVICILMYRYTVHYPHPHYYLFLLFVEQLEKMSTF